ncbi:MAG: hypothetical protein JO170_22085 [Verrucomicrobia bacterium]|nr:hypothetical protein [Verrucomicrobiota bacterium]
MKYHLRTRLSQLAAAFFVTLVSVGTVANTNAQGIALSSLKGRWALSLVGSTGCGHQSIYATFKLDATGSGSATVQFHGDCGDTTTENLPFVIQSLNPDGSGRANLSCGPACGWNLIIQVAKDGELFSAVDVDPVNPGNFLAGTAVRQIAVR